MTLDIAGTARAAWTSWNRTRGLLAPLTGLFLFVPQYAVLLLVPPAPQMPGEGADAAMAWETAFAGWMSANAPLYLAAALLVQFGTLATMAVLLSRADTTLGQALRHAAAKFVRYMLAVIVVTLPLAVPMLAMLRVPVLMPFAMAGLFYILARTAMIGPVLLVEPGIGAVKAVVRSWRLTAGNGVRLAAMLGVALLAGSILGSAISSVDALLSQGGGNPVVTAIIGALASGATWASTLAIAVVEAVAYRRLASRGI